MRRPIIGTFPSHITRKWNHADSADSTVFFNSIGGEQPSAGRVPSPEDDPQRTFSGRSGALALLAFPVPLCQNSAMSSFDQSALARRETVRLRLRPPSIADLEFIVNLFARPELVAHRPHPEPDSPEFSKTRLEHTIGHWRRYGFLEAACWVHARRPFFAMADLAENARRKSQGKR